MSSKLTTSIVFRSGVYGIAAIFLALLFRMTDSWTLDETGMMHVLSRPAMEAFHEYMVNLPMLSVYEILMWLWIRLSGSSEFLSRIPSLLCFAGILMVTFKIAVECAGSRAAEVKPFAVFSCLALASNSQVQHFATTTRPYAATMFVAGISLLYFLRWVRAGEVRDLAFSGAWLGLAVLFKVFALLQLVCLLPLLLAGSEKNGLSGNRRVGLCFRDLLVFASLPLLAVAVQWPLILYFQSRAALHQFHLPATAGQFMDLVLGSVFPLSVFALAFAASAVSWLASGRNSVSLKFKPLFACAWLACAPLLLIGGATLVSGVFLVSEKYVVVAYLPAALLAGQLFAATLAIRYTPVVPVVLLAVLSVSGVMSATTLGADTEDWRRAFEVARLIENSPEGRAPVLLFNSGFFEAQHKEFEGSDFVEAPARVYGSAQGLLAVPDYSRPEMIQWIEDNLLTESIMSDPRGILFIAKNPSQSKAILIAEMLGRRITGLDFDQTQIWLIFR